MEQRDPGEKGRQDLLLSQICGVREGWRKQVMLVLLA